VTTTATQIAEVAAPAIAQRQLTQLQSNLNTNDRSPSILALPAVTQTAHAILDRAARTLAGHWPERMYMEACHHKADLLHAIWRAGCAVPCKDALCQGGWWVNPDPGDLVGFYPCPYCVGGIKPPDDADLVSAREAVHQAAASLAAGEPGLAVTEGGYFVNAWHGGTFAVSHPDGYHCTCLDRETAIAVLCEVLA
jgi:hypothetical protein